MQDNSFSLYKLVILTTLVCGVISQNLNAKIIEDELYVQEVELNAVIEFFSKKTKKIIVPDADIMNSIRSRKSKIILPMELEKMEDVDIELWHQIFEDILKIYGYTLIKKGETYRLTTVKNSWDKYLPLRSIKDIDNISPTSEEVVVQVITLKHTFVDNVRSLFKYVSNITAPIPLYDNKTIIVTTHESKLKRFLELIKLVDVPPSQDQSVFEQYDLHRTNGNQMRLQILSYFQSRHQQNAIRKAARVPNPIIMLDDTANRILVNAIPQDQELIKEMINFFDKPIDDLKYKPLKIIHLQNSKAEELAPILNNVLKSNITTGTKNIKSTKSAKEEISIVPYKQINALIVSTQEPKTMSKIEHVIKELDVRRQQVLIRSTIIEVNNNQSFNFGADFGLKATPNNSSNFGLGAGTSLGVAGLNIDPANADNPVSLAPDLAKNGLQLMVPYKSFDVIPFVLNMANSNSQINVLATPSIICDDNEQALLRITENKSFDKTSVGPEGVQLQSFGGYHEAGIILSIKPTISNNKYLKLEIEQNVDRFIANDSGGETINKREASTVVTIPNNTSVVFGGLTERTSDDSTQSIPIISKIPVVGNIFKNKSRGSNNNTLYFFITPHIISEFEGIDDISDSYHDELTANVSEMTLHDEHFKNVRNKPVNVEEVMNELNNELMLVFSEEHLKQWLKPHVAEDLIEGLKREINSENPDLFPRCLEQSLDSRKLNLAYHQVSRKVRKEIEKIRVYKGEYRQTVMLFHSHLIRTLEMIKIIQEEQSRFKRRMKGRNK